MNNFSKKNFFACSSALQISMNASLKSPKYSLEIANIEDEPKLCASDGHFTPLK